MTRSNVLLPAPDGPRTATISPRRRATTDRREPGGRRTSRRCRRRQASSDTCLFVATGCHDDHGRQQQQDRGHRECLRLWQAPRLARAGARSRSAASRCPSESGSSSPRTRRARSPRRTRRRPAVGGEARGRRPPTTHAPARLPAWPRRRAGPRGSTAALRAGRARRTAQRPRRARGGRATSSLASRPATVSKVMSMPRPMVTADVPSGSIKPASSSLPSRGEALIAVAARKPIDRGDRAATTAKRSDVATGASGSTPSPSTGSHLGGPELGPRRQRPAVPPTSERSARPARRAARRR